jgi:membrane-bound serine protease (ClpP class)
MARGHIVVVLTAVFALACVAQVATQPENNAPEDTLSGRALAESVAVIPIHGNIDYGLEKSVERRVQEALAGDAKLFIFEMDTYGGDVAAAAEIGDRINNVKSETDDLIFTVAYVDKKAISAGALISLASRQIVMKDSTTLGDCQPIMYSPASQTMEPAPEKYETMVRALMRKYAQSNGYPEVLCEAMVNVDLEVYRVTFPDGSQEYLSKHDFDELPAERREAAEKQTIVKAGELLTMSSGEAKEFGFSRATVRDLDEAISLYAVPGAHRVRYETNWSEEMVRVLNSPALSSILLIVGIMALYMAFKVPGLGAPEAVAVACFAILFLSKYLIGLANVVEILIFLAGVSLLLTEIFLIPGFGIVGITGILCIFISLVLGFQKFTIPETTFEVHFLVRNLLIIFGSFMGATILFMFLVRFLPKTPLFGRLVLQTAQSPELGYVVGSAAHRDWVGARGVAVGPLRPSGRAEIDGETMLVVSDGEFIEPGTRIVVSEVRGNRVLVRKA